MFCFGVLHCEPVKFGRPCRKSSSDWRYKEKSKSSGLGIWKVGARLGKADVLDPELELEQLSLVDSDIQFVAEIVMPFSAMGVGYAFWLADTLGSEKAELLLLLRVRGRPARFAGL